MSEIVVIRLPGEPVGKGRPRFVRSTGRTYTPTKTRDYESALRAAGQMAMGNRPPFDCALDVQIVANMSIPASASKSVQLRSLSGELRPTKRPDADNLAKPALDALNGVVWRDDCIIVNLTVRKQYDPQPGLIVYVRPVLGGQA